MSHQKFESDENDIFILMKSYITKKQLKTTKKFLLMQTIKNL